MADFTVDITADRSAGIDFENQSTNISTGDTCTITSGSGTGEYKSILLGLTPPSSLLGRKITRYDIFMYITARSSDWTSTAYSTFAGNAILAAWDEATVTYATKPSIISAGISYQITSQPATGWYSVSTTSVLTPLNAGFLSNGNGLQIGIKLLSRYITFNSTRAASNKPYLKVYTSDATPTPSAHNPASGAYRDPYKDASFSWTTTDTSGFVYGGIQTTGSKFRYREVGAGSYTEITLSDNARTYTMPADTLTALKNYEWQVIETTTDGVSSTSTTWYQFTTTDTTPSNPIPVYPSLEYIQVDADNEFEWQHVVDTGSDQSQADLQYSLNGGAFTTLATVTGASETTTIAADTLPAGNLRWRVKTYNVDGVASEWSDTLSFVGVGTPATPSITSVSQCSRPVVNWSSLGQIAYRVQIGDYDTGEVQGTAKTFKLPYYIANGEYAVKVAILNASLIWSDWAEYTLTLSVTGPTAPTLTGTATAVAASLSFSATAEKLYLLRDGTPIADVTGLTSYADYMALGTVSYVLRAVDASDNYTDSAAASVTISVSYATIAAVDAPSQYKTLMLTRGAPRSLSGSISQVVTYKRYVGRAKPVAIFSGQEDEAYQTTVSFLTKTDADAFIALIRRRKTMIYRDSFGNRWFVVIGSTGNNQDHISQDLTLTLTVVDYVEEIEYSEV